MQYRRGPATVRGIMPSLILPLGVHPGKAGDGASSQETGLVCSRTIPSRGGSGARGVRTEDPEEQMLGTWY